MVKQPFSKRWLGVSLSSFNKASQRKWLWRFDLERVSFWRRVLIAKYVLDDQEWITKIYGESHWVGLWWLISLGSDYFRTRILIKVGDGRKTSLWTDWWCGDVVLKDMFPDLFVLARNKGAALAEYWRGGLADWLLTSGPILAVGGFLKFLSVVVSNGAVWWEKQLSVVDLF